MFKTDGIPDTSLLLEKGSMHLNDLALRAFTEVSKGNLEDVFSRDQHVFIEKVHLPQCERCRQKLERFQHEQIDQRDLLE